MGLSANQLGGIGIKQLSLEFKLVAKNEERGDKQADCRSRAGRVSDISDTPATQYLDYAVEEARHDNEAREATHA